MTPNDMPKNKPKHTWTPPQRHVPRAQQQPAPQQGSDNSARRRARRNGWNESR